MHLLSVAVLETTETRVVGTTPIASSINAIPVAFAAARAAATMAKHVSRIDVLRLGRRYGMIWPSTAVGLSQKKSDRVAAHEAKRAKVASGVAERRLVTSHSVSTI
jgi:hypothetical protein